MVCAGLDLLGLAWLGRAWNWSGREPVSGQGSLDVSLGQASSPVCTSGVLDGCWLCPCEGFEEMPVGIFLVKGQSLMHVNTCERHIKSHHMQDWTNLLCYPAGDEVGLLTG